MGAHRASLRADAEAGLRLGRDRLAHDDPARPLREHAAHHHRGRSRPASAAPTPSRVLPLHRAARLARPLRPPHRAQHPACAARRSESGARRRSRRRLRRAWRMSPRSFAAPPGRSFRRSKPRAARGRRCERGLIQRQGRGGARRARMRAVARRRDVSPAPTHYPDLAEAALAVLDVPPARRRRANSSRPSSRCRDAARRAVRTLRDRVRRAPCRQPARGRKCSSPPSASRPTSPPARFRQELLRGRRYRGGDRRDPGGIGTRRRRRLPAVAAAFKASGATLACLCASDETYARQGPTPPCLTSAGPSGSTRWPPRPQSR